MSPAIVSHPPSASWATASMRLPKGSHIISYGDYPSDDIGLAARRVGLKVVDAIQILRSKKGPLIAYHLRVPGGVRVVNHRLGYVGDGSDKKEWPVTSRKASSRSRGLMAELRTTNREVGRVPTNLIILHDCVRCGSGCPVRQLEEQGLDAGKYLSVVGSESELVGHLSALFGIR